ncbi:MAG TPA: cation:proton antiporter [Candidatus Binatia bacterium]|jgi:Kef-type K+ transport system membrane component KefB|nr:cation:proton antiporter [Candidatus Binatia bacterium]
MTRFQALDEHQLLVFWVQLLVLVMVARGLGGLARRLGQPSVIGELAAGVLLGPSVLGALSPSAWEWLFPSDPVHAGLMAGVGWIGVFFLLVLAGFETDLGLVRRLGRAAAWVSTGSLVVPLAFGLTVGIAMPDAFLGRSHDRLGFALFMATALAISSLPVVVKVLTEMDLVRRNFGQLTLAAGMANDIVGWVLLGVIARLTQSGDLSLGPLLVSLGGFAIFGVAAFTIGQRAVDAMLRAVRERQGGVMGALTVVLLVSLGGASATQAIGLEGVLGAFIAGIVLGRSKFQDTEVYRTLEAITLAFFAPLFFARAGLRVDMALLADPLVIWWSLIVLAAASASKLFGAYLGARAAGLTPREGIALGAGLNARGALEIVVATVGLSLGVLTQASYTMVVLMAMATSMMAPVMLRLIVRDWRGSPEERERLERERQLGRNILVRSSRVLLPSAGGPNSMLAAHILDLTWPEDVEATVLSVGDEAARREVDAVCAVFARRPVEHAHATDKAPLDAIMAHAQLGYGAMAVGATDRRVDGRLISPVVDGLLAASPLPVLIVRRGPEDDGAPRTFRRILVPAIGTTVGRAAQEVAYALARRSNADVVLAHVITVPRSGVMASILPWRRGAAAENGNVEERARVAEQVVAEARAHAEEMGVRAVTALRTGVSVAEEMETLVRESEADLVVLTANVRQLSGRPFLGHGVEHLLERSDTTLVIVATPPGWGGGR